MSTENLDFHALFEAVPGLYLVLSPSFHVVAVTSAYLAGTMTRREAIVGRHLFDVFPDNPDDVLATGVSNLRASLELVLRHKRPNTMAVQKYDIRRPTEAGGGFEERFWSPTNSPVLSAAGEVLFIMHSVADVTDFVRLKRYDQAQTQLNQELESRAGQMEAEIYRRAQEIQEANHQLHALQLRLQSRVAANAVEIHDANEALRRRDEQLRQSQKLESIGHLAGGVAHDFNNLLSVILSYTHLARWKVGEAHPVLPYLEEIEKAGARAADLTQQLLAFSRRQVLDLRVLDLNVVIENVSKMLRRVIGEDIEFRATFAPDLANIKGDPGQIEQILMNLLVNARDAMPNGGKLTIETANVHLDAGYVATHLGATAGPNVMLAVTDTGVGMDKETQQHIFEPFFTTKDVGKGTGLGLSTVFGIVKQSNGHISVYSEPNAGSTFRIYFPRTDAEGTWAPSEAREMTDERGHETILLVEDEDQVRTVASSILTALGYQVVTTSGPSEALRASELHGGRIDLLLTDIVMPEMNGRQLAKRIALFRPNIATVFMSGYTDNAIQHQGVLDASDAFLQKPFNPSSLARKVREVLDRAPES